MKLHVADRDSRALERIRDAGVTVIPTTGRPFPGALPWARRFGLEGPIICYQGAEVRTLDGQVLFDHGIPHDLAMEVIRYARERDLHIQAYRDDQLIVERDRPEAHQYAAHAGMQIHLVADLDTAMAATTPKLVIVADVPTIEATLAETREIWKGRLNIATSVPEYLEFTALNSDKALALAFLSQRLGVPQPETAAVGDGRNDASMIAWAGLGVAVEGSPPEVVAAAGNRTIPPPGHGGIDRLADLLLG
jgi:Cof subfamily protein (haloacid dehalogenase superfamily)